jgi:hypothetical protein
VTNPGAAPRSDYLTMSTSVVLDSNGNGTATLAPSVGQYWTPKLVRVGTTLLSSPVAYCVLYEGAATVKNQTTFIDDTSAGSGDTTSMVAGTVVQFGEALTAVWIGGNPGDTAVMSVFGVSCNTPPSESDLPTTPGTHFAGKPVQQTSVVQISQNGISLAPNAGFYSSGLIDVRSFQSYSIQINATAQSVPAKFDEVTVQLFWYKNSSATDFVFSDTASVIPNWLTAGTFNFSGGNLYLQDNHHGAYLSVLVTNKSLTITQSLNISITGSSRILSQPFARQGISPSFLVGPPFVSIGASGLNTIPMLYTFGRIRVHLDNNSGAAMNLFVATLSGAPLLAVLGVGNSTSTDYELILPKAVCTLGLSTGAAGNVTCSVVKLFDGG